jgi:hypothetical protein
MTAPGGPFAGMSDHRVLESAAAHLQKAAALPLGSLLAKRHWALFRRAMTELERREAERVMRQLAWRELRAVPWRKAASTGSGSTG